MEKILMRLRGQTNPAHKRLEAHIDLMGRVWSLDFYRLLLQKFYGFYAVIELPIFSPAEWAAINFDVAKRLKTRLLIQDLEVLGFSTHDIKGLPRCQRAPSVQTFAQALGCAYVLEGATLGGQVINRHLHRELDILPSRGSAFFNSYGADVGSMWRDFVAVLSTYPLSHVQQNELVQSAVDTFETLDEWLFDIL